LFDEIGKLVVNVLLLSLDDGYSFDVSLFLSLFDDVECSLLGLVLDGLLHFLDSLFDASYDHGF
jgi:hypothetical protein